MFCIRLFSALSKTHIVKGVRGIPGRGGTGASAPPAVLDTFDATKVPLTE